MAEPAAARTLADLGLGPLGYGAANVGNLYRAMSDEQAWDILDAAWESGIRYFDTAPHYGLGLSEQRLGAFLATKPRVEYVVSTKVGRLLEPSPETAGVLDDAHMFAVPAAVRRVWDFTAEGVRRSLEESLRRLDLDRVDIAYLHDPEEHDLQPALETGIPGVTALRDEGLVTAVGVGSKSTEALLSAVRAGGLDVAMVAGRYTLAEQPAAGELVPACRDAGVAIVAAAVFNTGLLAAPQPRAGARYDYDDVPDAVLDRVRRIEAICAQYDVALPVAALQFPLREPAVRSVVVGGATPAQVRENAARMTSDVPDAMWQTLQAEGLVPG